MDIFVEKEFIEEFELDYDCSEIKTDIQKIVFSIFTEYTHINLFINAPESFIEDSRILSLFSDSNLNVRFNFDFDQHFNFQFTLSNQTLVFTKNAKSWFTSVKSKNALCYSYLDYESGIQNFINRTHFKIDLADPENIPINWNIFKFLKTQTNFIILSDPYILSDCSGQEIRKNLIPLLRENLNENNFYSVFIITDVNKVTDIKNKLGQINSSLTDFKKKIYVFSIFKEIGNFGLHDRLLYSNYTITESGTGFNLNNSKPLNSILSSASFFEKVTYKRLNIHFKELRSYVNKLEKYNHIDKPFKANSEKAYKAFNDIVAGL